MKVELITAVHAFAHMRDAWNALASRREDVSIFQSWAWQFMWWKNYGQNHLLYLLTATEGSTLVGVLPLYIASEQAWGGLRLRMLRPIGTGGDTAPDYLGPITAPGREVEIGRAFLEYLETNKGQWDSILLSDIPTGSPFLEELHRWSARGGWRVQSGVSARISYLDLPESWDAYLNAQSGDRRYTIRNTRRKFLAQEGARFFVWDRADDIERGIERLAQLHHLRWQAKGEAHSFSSEAYNRFHREVMASCMKEGLLRLYCMEIKGEIVAMYYCYAWNNAIYYFQGGFDPAYDKLRPGLCLMGFAIEHAIQEGRACFDMLRGEYEYKRQWAKQTRETCYVLCHRPGLRTALYHLRTALFPQFKTSLKALLGRPQV